MADQTVAEVACPECGGSRFASRGMVLAVGPRERPPAPPVFEARGFAQAIEHRLQCLRCMHEFSTLEHF